MTTIATDGVTMAGDGRLHIKGSVVSEEAVKLARANNGAVVGCSGSACDANSFVEWLDTNGEKPKLDEDFGALVLWPTGAVEWFTNKLSPAIADVPAAMGSGMDFAVGAMLAGAEPEEAVRFAAQRDVYTGGAISVLSRLPDVA